jgi:hypothetical protein
MQLFLPPFTLINKKLMFNNSKFLVNDFAFTLMYKFNGELFLICKCWIQIKQEKNRATCWIVFFFWKCLKIYRSILN